MCCDFFNLLSISVLVMCIEVAIAIVKTVLEICSIPIHFFLAIVIIIDLFFILVILGS